MSVQVFSKPSCVQCTATYQLLKSRDVDYTVVDITEDDEALNKVQQLGHRQLPVVFVADDHHWSGFRPDMIKAL